MGTNAGTQIEFQVVEHKQVTGKIVFNGVRLWLHGPKYDQGDIELTNFKVFLPDLGLVATLKPSLQVQVLVYSASTWD